MTRKPPPNWQTVIAPAIAERDATVVGKRKNTIIALATANMSIVTSQSQSQTSSNSSIGKE